MKEKALAWAKGTHSQYINGVWRSAQTNFTCTNPATSEVICELPQSSQADIDEAVEAARKAFKGAWASTTRRERSQSLIAAGKLIRDNQEELAAIIAIENGKTYSEALYDDMPDTADIFDYYAGWTDKFYGESSPVENGFINYVNREPMGVCGLIVPWNFPLLLAMWKLAPALAMGNTVVIKPSEETPLSLIRCIELFDQHNIFPAGVINLVLGDGKVGAAVAEHKDIDKVSFTGSTQTGKHIVKASGNSNLKTVTLELGGKAPVILFDDLPDYESAVDRCFHVAFSQKGEKCTEPTRLIIQDSMYEKFVTKLCDKANAIRCGNPFDNNVQQGAQASQAQFDKIMSYIEQGKKDGANLLCGGTDDRQAKNQNGLFIRPTIFGDVDNRLSIAQEEIFGPVLVVQRFKTEEEAITLANDSQYGLAAGLYTSDISKAHRVVRELDAGQVFVNKYGCYDFASPFGGFKQSGWGKEMGIHSLEAYTRAKSVWIAY